MADEVNTWDETSIEMAEVVVTLGAVCVSELAPLWPSSATIGDTESTPLNALMPPADPVDAEKVHAWLSGSATTATRR